MANSLFPGFVRMFYKSNGQEHRHDFPIKADTPNGIPTATSGLMTKGGTPVTMLAGMDAYATALSKLMPVSSFIERYELYSLATPTSAPLLVRVGAINQLGTGSGPLVNDSQITITFKTQLGGLIRMVALDTNWPYDIVTGTYNPTATADVDGTINYLLGDTSIRVGRDGGFPLTFKRWITKQNDTLRKQRLGI